MFRNYLVVAWRNLWRHRVYSAINIAGLAVSLAGSLLMLLYIRFELSYDRYHDQADHIFRVYDEQPQGAQLKSYAKVPGPLADFLKREYAPIEETVRIVPAGKVLVSYGEKHFYEGKMLLADPSMLRVFALQFIHGDSRTALAEPHALLITEAMAAKYFGSEDPIGKTIRVNRKTDLTITGVLRDLPRNTHLRFGFLVSMRSVDSIFQSGYLDDKYNTFAYTYVRLQGNVDPAVAGNLLAQAQEQYFGGSSETIYRLQPITSIHLHSHLGGEYEPNSDVRTLYILAAIAFLVLLVACINYANLAVALYGKRVREIGLRKVVGSSQGQLVAMFLADSFLMVIVSCGFGIALAELLLPWVSRVLGRPLDVPVDGTFLLGLLALVVVEGLLSGAYPALLVSRLQPADMLRNQRTGASNNPRWRYGLILAQFAVFIFLATATITIERQVRYIQRKDLGFVKEALVVVPLSDPDMGKRTESLKKEFLSHPGVRSATATSDLPGVMTWVTGIRYEGGPDRSSTMGFLRVDRDFVKTFGVNVEEGRDLSRDKGPTGEHEYLLNQAAAQALGWQDPLGKGFSTFHGGGGRIIGVVSDFHFKSLHDRIEPLFLTLSEGPFDYLCVRVNAEQVRDGLASMEKAWNRLAPDSPFEYFFYDEFYDRLYRDEIQFGRVVLVFSVLTILIACNGLVALVSFAAEQRTKEIGIRKVLGASVREIVFLLSRDFLRWVVLANAIAWPAAWLALNRWLQDFAYRIELGLWVFALAGVLALGIAWLTVSWQAIRAALANPVEALRYE